MQRIHPGMILTPLCLALLIGGTTRRAAAQTTITLDTALLRGTAGYVDFQFNPGTTGTLPLNATARITNASAGPGGAFGAVNSAESANSTGALPGTVTIANTDVANGLVQALTFGDTLRFDVGFLTIATPGADTGSTFALYLLGADLNFLPTTDPTGQARLAEMDLSAGGNPGGPVVFGLGLSAAPEPSSGLPVLLTLIAIGLSRTYSARHRRK